MTLNIFSLSIIIKKRKILAAEAIRQEMVEKLYDQYKDQRMNLYHIF